MHRLIMLRAASCAAFAMLFVASLGFSADDEDSRDKQLLKLGSKLGEIRGELKLIDKATTSLPKERRKKFESLKDDIEKDLISIEKDVVAKKTSVPDALKKLDQHANSLSGWVLFAENAGKRDGGTARDAPLTPFGNAPVVIAMSPEDYFGYQLMAPFLNEFARDPTKFADKLKGIQAEILKKYPEGLGKALQKQQMDAVQKILDAEKKKQEEALKKKEKDKEKK